MEQMGTLTMRRLARGLQEDFRVHFVMLCLQPQRSHRTAMQQTKASLRVGEPLAANAAHQQRAETICEITRPRHAGSVGQAVAERNRSGRFVSGGEELWDFSGIMLTVGVEQQKPLESRLASAFESGDRGCAFAAVGMMSDNLGAGGPGLVAGAIG